MFSGFEIFAFVVHDPIGRGDGPFWKGAIHQAQREIRFDEPFLQHSKIPPRESSSFNLYRQILDLPPTRQFPAGLAWLRNLDDGRPD